MSQNLEPALEEERFARWRVEAHDLAPFITLGVLVLYFGFVTRNFYTLATLCDVLRQGAVLAIVAAGLTFVLLCGEIDLSVGMVALWTACLCGVLFESSFAAGKGGREAISGPTVAWLILLPLLTSLLLGISSGLLTVASRLPSFIITLAMMNIAQGLSRYITQSQKFAVPALLRDLGNAGIDLQPGVKFPHSALLAAVILFCGHILLRHTRFGRFIYMTGGNREAARLAGVGTGRVIVGCLALCASLAGLGGLVNAGRLESVSQDQNADLLLNAVACVVLGGTSLFGGEGGMGRTALGVITFSVLQVGLNRITWINDLMRPFLMGVVLMTALVINGLLARKRQN
jgi:ribose transport system permease protein